MNLTIYNPENGVDSTDISVLLYMLQGSNGVILYKNIMKEGFSKKDVVDTKRRIEMNTNVLWKIVPYVNPSINMEDY